jgi:alkanesulfonate monooxygenase SsuD/methylene tetrahydromethanopterin reductase-like flavin-dependent oxidoreductase (luciferase family)
LIEHGYVLVGSPATVAARLAAVQQELGVGIFLYSGRTGDMPKELAWKSMEFFAREVIPRLRAHGAGTRGNASPGGAGSVSPAKRM